MNLEITGRQAWVMQKALEVYARLGMGQFNDALDCLPLKIDERLSGWHESKLGVGRILRRHMKGNVDGWQSYLGIMSPDVNSYSKIAWDMYASIRAVVIGNKKPISPVSDEPLVKIS